MSNFLKGKRMDKVVGWVYSNQECYIFYFYIIQAIGFSVPFVVHDIISFKYLTIIATRDLKKDRERLHHRPSFSRELE